MAGTPFLEEIAPADPVANLDVLLPTISEGMNLLTDNEQVSILSNASSFGGDLELSTPRGFIGHR